MRGSGNPQAKDRVHLPVGARDVFKGAEKTGAEEKWGVVQPRGKDTIPPTTR